MSTQRILKFRAFDKKEGKWLCGYKYGNLGGFSLFGEVILMGEWESVVGRFIVNQKDRTPDDLVVMQFTGLKDKNGREIYEGDFLSAADQEGGFMIAMGGIVEWYEDGWYVNGECAKPGYVKPGWYNPFNNSLAAVVREFDCKIIGNRFENPELLNS